MLLRDFIVSEKNIYLAIYSVKSYIFDPQLLDYDDKEKLNLLADPFNENIVNEIITEVKEVLKKILNKKEYLFEVHVYFKPKDYKDNEKVFRPIHTAKLVQLIAMVALMHPLIYELPCEEKHWKLNLSNYSRLIPNNFYGNRVSPKPEELFKKWNEQYKKYTQKVNDNFKTYRVSKEYKYELKLDLENFFPSVNPLLVYSMLMKYIPVTLSGKENINDFKTMIYKLLVCKVTNLKTDISKEKYYGKGIVNKCYTKGIAQGLPQSYFFGNICMIEIAKIFEKEFGGNSLYYVDDSYIYTSKKIDNREMFIEQLENVNYEIERVSTAYLEEIKNDLFISGKNHHIEFYQKADAYLIKVHSEEGGKSTYTKIQDAKEGEVYLKILSREASQIGADITSTYSEEEDNTMLSRTEKLLETIEAECNNNLEEESDNEKAYKEKLVRYKKYFKYRALKLRLKTQKTLNRELFEVLVKDISDEEMEKPYKILEKGLSVEDFFYNFKKDIWQVALDILIKNTIYEQNEIRNYIRNIIKIIYPEELLECSFLSKMYGDYLEGKEIENLPDCYRTLNRKTAQKMVTYSNMHSKALKKEFRGTRLETLAKDVLSSFDVCSKEFVENSIIVSSNSNRLQRMFLNAIYSKIFKVSLSEDVVLSSYDKKGITYGELRSLVYLRNSQCDIHQFFNWKMDVMSPDNLQNVDYTLFEVLGVYKKYVKTPSDVDNLILVHKYTCDIWKNGAKHLYFYTLHNQEHAVDLVKNIIKIVKTFSYLRITSYDYYLLFIACYLHDISMVRIASANDFLLDEDISDEIVTDFIIEKDKNGDIGEVKKQIVEIYKKVDEFFENKIRSKHAKESAEEIRKRDELSFLESSVRENVAEIAESHMMDVKDIYFVKGDAKAKLISYKFDKILLRFADLLDMSERRVSKPILNHNIDNMSTLSAFHWISHLLIEGYELTSEYINNVEPDALSIEGYLLPEKITEKVTLSVYVNLSQLSKMDGNPCDCVRISKNGVTGNGFELELNNKEEKCSAEKCNFLCKWFNKKNDYLVKEMQALKAYLLRVPKTERFYNPEIVIKVIISNPTDITDEQFEILKQKMI